jgi:hypothetical protein
MSSVQAKLAGAAPLPSPIEASRPPPADPLIEAPLCEAVPLESPLAPAPAAAPVEAMTPALLAVPLPAAPLPDSEATTPAETPLATTDPEGVPFAGVVPAEPPAGAVAEEPHPTRVSAPTVAAEWCPHRAAVVRMPF